MATRFTKRKEGNDSRHEFRSPQSQIPFEGIGRVRCFPDVFPTSSIPYNGRLIVIYSVSFQTPISTVSFLSASFLQAVHLSDYPDKA